MTRYKFDASWKLAMRGTILFKGCQQQLPPAFKHINVPTGSLRCNEKVSLGSQMALLACPQHSRFPNDFHGVHLPCSMVLSRTCSFSHEFDHAKAAFAQSLDRLVIVAAG